VSAALLEVEGLGKDFPVAGGLLGRATALRAVEGGDFRIVAGETLGLVGESGCGKSTVARLVLRLIEPSTGRICFDGADITRLPEPAMRPFRKQLQIVFQDPYSALDPRMRVGESLAEPLRNFGVPGRRLAERVAELLDIVGLPRDAAARYPHAFSGGQRQRIGIARALALQPRLIVCDEAVSALDVSVQAQILNLLGEVQRRFGLAMLFISHNLGVVRHVSHRVAVRYLGRLVELADEAPLFTRPLHPYTQALLAAVPDPDPRRRRGQAPPRGEIPSALAPPAGCHFHPRCPRAEPRCRAEVPMLREAEAGRWVRCHFPG
jgi:oligopeptide transport system ATP-binding protein